MSEQVWSKATYQSAFHCYLDERRTSDGDLFDPSAIQLHRETFEKVLHDHGVVWDHDRTPEHQELAQTVAVKWMLRLGCTVISEQDFLDLAEQSIHQAFKNFHYLDGYPTLRAAAFKHRCNMLKEVLTDFGVTVRMPPE